MQTFIFKKISGASTLSNEPHFTKSQRLRISVVHINSLLPVSFTEEVNILRPGSDGVAPKMIIDGQSRMAVATAFRNEEVRFATYSTCNSFRCSKNGALEACRIPNRMNSLAAVNFANASDIASGCNCRASFCSSSLYSCVPVHRFGPA